MISKRKPAKGRAAVRSGPKKKAPAAMPVVRSVRPKQETAPQDSPSHHVAPILLLSGDGMIAAEYAQVAAAKGYVIHVWNVDPLPARSSLPDGSKVVTSPTSTASVALEVTLLDRSAKQANLRALDAALPPTALILSSSLTVSATEQASWISGKHRLVGFAALPTYATKPASETAPTVFTPRQTLDTAATFFLSIGQRMELVQDRVGLVSARIICQLINEAAFALQDDVARPEDVDTAMKLGVHYPHGPFAWAEILGVRNVVAVIQALHTEYQEERYRLAPLLKHMALGGEWWHRRSETSTKDT